MKTKIVTFSIIILSILALSSCDSSDKIKSSSAKKVEGRWYTSAQLIRGKSVFKENCAVCHGDKAQGLTEDWKVAGADGKFPAPPLNGSAHAWHHSKEILKRTINNGGIALGGTMTAFKEKLSEEEKEAVLSYVMSLWSGQTYQAWAKRNPL